MKRTWVSGACALVGAWVLLAGSTAAWAQDGDGEESPPVVEPTGEGEPAPGGEVDGENPPADSESPPGGDAAPAGDPNAVPAPAAEPAPEAAVAPTAPAYPPEALVFLPEAALSEIGAAITRYLRPSDWTALHQHCGGGDHAANAACMQRPDTTTLLGTLYARSVVANLLGRMDAEFVEALDGPTLEALGETCAKQAESWAECVFTKSPDDEGCLEAEDTLALCLTSNDAVSDAYQDIQAAKKKAFGREFFVDLRGLLGLFTIEQVTAMRQACPQTEAEALLTCLETNELSGDVLKGFAEATAGILADAEQELAVAGQPLAEADKAALGQRVMNMLLTMPLATLESLSKACEKEDPTLATAKTLADIDRALTCIDGKATRDPVANPAFIDKARLKGWLEAARVKVADVLREKEKASQAKMSELLLMVVGGLALLGAIIILLLPFGLKKKYPQAGGSLWKSAAMAAATFVATMAILGGTLLAIRTVQGRVAIDSTSPKMRVADAAFAVLLKDEALEAFSIVSTLHLDFIKTPLRELQKAGEGLEGLEKAAAFAAFIGEHWANLLEEPEFKRLAKNLSTVKEKAEDLKSLLQLFRNVDWLMGLMPIILALMALVLYLLPLRELLAGIITAPARRAAGETGGPSAGRMLAGELKGVPGFLLVLLVVLPLAGVAMALALEPVMGLFIEGLISNVLVILGDETSGLILYGSMIGGMLLLVALLVVFIMTIGAAAKSAQAILRARFQKDVPLGRHAAFYGKAVLAILWALAFPVLFAFGLGLGATALFDSAGDETVGWHLWAVPLGGLLLFIVFFVLLRVGKALKFLKKYRPAAQPTA